MAWFGRRSQARANPGDLQPCAERNMNGLRSKYSSMALMVSALVGFLALRPVAGSAAEEQTFPLLQIGTRTYTNVTVTTKARKYIFILHSTGMANIRVADLPP